MKPRHFEETPRQRARKYRKDHDFTIFLKKENTYRKSFCYFLDNKKEKTFIHLYINQLNITLAY